ncbi:uncharacterized protein LOC135128547 isoform X4 [Zophobas morio]|uniref:uncharacterized protein LOC135128547 isoform X4 n=1 Tax=Zophobas morio TaxID=2755281 RepID=UPI003082EB11
MIVIFHLFANLFYNLCKRRINARNSSWSNFTLTKLNVDKSPLAQRDAENDIKFDPPVYKQRYQRAVELLLHEKWKDQLVKVVDFGCGEFGLFVFLKNVVPAREIVFIDVDEFLISDYLYKVYPLNADYLTKRQDPLNVKVFAGSIAYPDENLLGTDAVVSLEVIEHLYPDTLDALPYNLFAYVVPKVVIVTTPNADFNVLFENLHTFRHSDHKFEWTREQFESWATNITLRFPRYTVQFDGVGLGPTGCESCGQCSQLAIFIRKDIICDKGVEVATPCTCKTSTCRSNSQDGLCCLCECQSCLPKYSFGICTYNSKDVFRVNGQNKDFKLIKSIKYPVDTDTRTAEEKIVDELKYRMHLCGSANELYYNYERDRIEIPLERLVYVTSGPFPSKSEIKSILLKHNYQIEECQSQDTKQVETCVIYEMENGASGSDTEASGYESDKYDTDDGHMSDWEDTDLTTWTDPANKDEKRVSHKGVKAQLHLEVNGSRKQQGALFDSGYQKSPSVPDESPQSVSAVNKEVIPLEFKNPNLEKPNRLSNILSVFDNFDKINELDAIHKDKKYFNFSSNLPHKEVMKKLCQEIAKHPVAGPSRDRKNKHLKKSNSSDSDESVEDVKSITTCILENSLNKLEFQDEPPRGDVIQELIEPAAPEPLVQHNEVIEPVVLVENGDLANNNRDLEGNNYPAENIENPEPENDNAIDNLDPNNVNVDNNNEIAEAVVEEPVAEERVEENAEVEPPENVEAEWSSREALFDANSQVDLLEEFEVGSAAPAVNTLVFPSNCIVIAENINNVSEAVLPPEESGFPNWLLQIFEEGDAPEDDLHDEPHFYCQGDGLGMTSFT